MRANWPFWLYHRKTEQKQDPIQLHRAVFKEAGKQSSPYHLGPEWNSSLGASHHMGHLGDLGRGDQGAMLTFSERAEFIYSLFEIQRGLSVWFERK